ncbi:SDR family oxidoreductase [Candidatus Halobonum tyrrellensis]|uniref:Oxidoreductase n=1 Tax=Candidatus Halobonum tyrrellensis G22 TaxID=1324957 RepID=V4GXM1_9EURY|nr:SDR family oxidoreductase [Candidatus Halobonum tyrrellensis]ESP89901.1 oxidoreductase [Candidatus Halobonum tyrrellensis G22]
MERTVLITGCSSGIGRATAKAFLDEEWTVYATARNPADVETLGDRDGCRIATLDVTDDGDVERVVDRILDEEGRIDCLVNNAGYSQRGPIEDVPTEAVRDQFETNVYGPHRLTRAVLPAMRRRENGAIVNVSSAVGRLAVPGEGVYSGSKHALEAMTDALRNEVREYGITVSLVEPGPVDTPFAERADDEMDELDRSGAYDAFYDMYDDYDSIGAGAPGSVTPERVASDVVNAASATKPAARYPVGPVARAAELVRHLPASLSDKVWGLVRTFT